MILTHNHFFMLGLAVTLAIGAELNTLSALLVSLPPRGAVDERFPDFIKKSNEIAISHKIYNETTKFTWRKNVLLKTKDGIDRDTFFVNLGGMKMCPPVSFLTKKR